MLWEQCFFLRFTLVLFFVFASCLWILFAFDPFLFFWTYQEADPHF